MSRADELLNSLSGENPEVYAASSDDEPHIIIRPDRTIEIPESLKRIAVQHDHDVETVMFDAPRYWDNHDLSLLNIYVHYMRPDEKIGRYLTKNVTIDPIDSNIMHFEWTISRNVTFLFGNITFIVCAKKTDDDGIERVHWNSELNDEMYVSRGLEPDDIKETNPDVIDQLLTRMDIVEDAVEKSDVLTAVKFYTDAKTFVDDAVAEHEQLRSDIIAERSKIDNFLMERSSGRDCSKSETLQSYSGYSSGCIKSNGSSAVLVLESLNHVVCDDEAGEVMGDTLFGTVSKEYLQPMGEIKFDINGVGCYNDEEYESVFASITNDSPELMDGAVTKTINSAGHVVVKYIKKNDPNSGEYCSTQLNFPKEATQHKHLTPYTIRFHSINVYNDTGLSEHDAAVFLRWCDGYTLGLSQGDERDVFLGDVDDYKAWNSDFAILKFSENLSIGGSIEIVFDLLDMSIEKNARVAIREAGSGVSFTIEGGENGAYLINEPLYFTYPLKYRSDPMPSDELYDIRVDVDGVIHPTAGAAVRSQVKKLSSEGSNDESSGSSPTVQIAVDGEILKLSIDASSGGSLTDQITVDGEILKIVMGEK